MPADLLIIFFSASVLLALTPGPDNIFVLSQSLVFGGRAGLLVTLGLCTGLILHTSLVAFGVAALIAASEQLLLVVKLLGAAYLVFLAWTSWKSSSRLQAENPRQMLAGWQLYRRGIIMNASNPKVAIFFLAFLPQFVDIAYGSPTTQILLLGLLFILSTILVFGGIAVLAGRYSVQLNATLEHRLILNRTVSVVFVLLAINLLWNFL